MTENTVHTDTEIVPVKILFIINPGSGNKSVNWGAEIDSFFSGLPYQIEKFALPQPCDQKMICQKIASFSPDRVVAVGGDGTVKLAAECISGSAIALGILPAGSANGLAKELGIPLTPQEALEVIIGGSNLRIHLIKVNDGICIHLSDIGFNAYVVKKFETFGHRGMWGYVKAAWKVLWQHETMEITLNTGSGEVKKEAAMIVIANATRYGSGAVINPAGRLDDDLFEVVVLKKISFTEIFKMVVTHRPYDPEKTELLQTTSLAIKSRKKVHFQVDGEYLGKVQQVKATLLPGALKMIVPAAAPNGGKMPETADLSSK
jgi:diacylglycerol kinase (ATP)